MLVYNLQNNTSIISTPDSTYNMLMEIEDRGLEIQNKNDLCKCLALADWVKLKMVHHSVVRPLLSDPPIGSSCRRHRLGRLGALLMPEWESVPVQPCREGRSEGRPPC
jgi:hypothetical protein